MTTSGSAIFFDGKTSARHDVTVELAPEALRMHEPDGAVLAAWGYDELETLSAPDDVLRLGKFGNPVLARLEVRDSRLAAAIDDLSEPVDRSGRSEGQMRRKIVLWTVAAAAALSSSSWACRQSRPGWLRSFPTRSSAGWARWSTRSAARSTRPARIRLSAAPRRRRSRPGGIRQADAPARTGGRLAHPLRPAVVRARAQRDCAAGRTHHVPRA